MKISFRELVAAWKKNKKKAEQEAKKLAKVPPLAKFGEKIMQYKTVQTQIEDKESVIIIGFLKINAQPMKSSLITW